MTGELPWTVPQKTADQYGIRPGDELEWIPGRESIRLELVSKAKSANQLTLEERLTLFDATTKWIDDLQADQLKEAKEQRTRIAGENRGWTREELYERSWLPWSTLTFWFTAATREILCEDFEHGRMYGNVRIRNPFVALGLE